MSDGNRNFEQDIEQLGSDIVQAVNNIMSSKELLDARDSIKRTVNETIQGVKNAQRNHTRYPTGSTRRPVQPPYPAESYPRRATVAPTQEIRPVRPKNNSLAVYSRRNQTGYTGPALQAIIGGMVTLGGFGPLLDGFSTMNPIQLLVTGAIGVVGAVFFFSGVAKLRLRSLFRKFSNIIGGRFYYPLRQLADYSGMTTASVRHAIVRMIHNGMLRETYLDEEGKNLIIGKETYDLYLESKRRQEQAAEPVSQTPPEPVSQADDGSALGTEELQRLGSDMIFRIRQINAELPETEISEKLDRLEDVCSRIFAYVEQHPQKMPHIRRFMEYYLPTTLQLMEAYRELEGHGNRSSVNETKAEIKAALDKIIRSFDVLFDNLIQSDLIHLSADINALEAMLAQEGLTPENSIFTQDGEEAQNG